MLSIKPKFIKSFRPIKTYTRIFPADISYSPIVENSQSNIEIIRQDEKSRFDEFVSMVAPSPRVIEYVQENALSLIFLGVIVYAVIAQTHLVSTHNTFLNPSMKKIDPEDIDITFSNVAGLQQAKLELQEVVDFLKNPETFSNVGAKIPKGCLLTGAPGLGKTLLAKAVAGEADVPFFACSASEFIEMYVGVGAKRIRDLFKKANEMKPCIIFIDEIDAIGKQRNTSTSMSNDERDQTINQLLTEMDGFNDNSGIVIIAATNRADILDQALTRPGRFDRQILLEYPNYVDRVDILRIHTKDKPLDENVNIECIAKSTVGLTGAELANIANEAAIFAARRKSSIILNIDFNDAIDRVVLGSINTSIISKEKKKLIAHHEAGHALVALTIPNYDKITKVSIVPRGKARGVTMFSEDEDHGSIYTRQYIENKLFVALGGRAAEEIKYGKHMITTGSVGDIEVVAQLARAMIEKYGYSDELGPSMWSDASPETAYLIDKQISNIVKSAYKHSKQIILDNIDSLELIADALYEKEELTEDELHAIIKPVQEASARF